MSSVNSNSFRRVLSICDDPNMQDLLKEALERNPADPSSLEDGAGQILPPPCDGPERLSFELVCVNNWEMVYKEMKAAREQGSPFCLILVSVQMNTWDSLHENMEKVWELDGNICCLVCLPDDASVGIMNVTFSRPDQWFACRMPRMMEELFQLALCLSGSSSSSSRHQMDADLSRQTNCHFELESHSNVAEQQAELAMARDELATSKVYVNNVIRSMADSLLVIDANMTIGSVNPSLLNLLGYEEEALVGQSPGLIFGEEFAQGSIIENLLLQGSVSGIESSFLTSQGRMIPISVSGSMMQDEQGQFQGLVCVAQDITERKRMEEEKLELHKQLLDTSRQLGMAEVASDVLHNVGNVLNSINVSIGIVADLVKNSMVGDVGRISQLFHKHREDLGAYFCMNPKGKQVPAYLEKLSIQLVEEQRTAIAELDRLRENAQHAQHCVSSQQDVAKATGITEPLAVHELIEEALRGNLELFESTQIEVVREFQEVPLLIVDKHKVLEVLTDIIQNGCQAMASSPMKQLVVRAKLIPGPPDSVCLEVEDSGVGIAPGDLTKIFGQGQKSKDGSHGMSLHNGALVAKNLGGGLRAHSEGLGHGALFSLDLPGNFHFPDL